MPTISCFEALRSFYTNRMECIPIGRQLELESLLEPGQYHPGGAAFGMTRAGSPLHLTWDEMRENGRLLDAAGVELDFNLFDKNPPKICTACKNMAAERLQERQESKMRTRFDRINDTPAKAAKKKAPKKKPGLKKTSVGMGWGTAVAVANIEVPIDRRDVATKVRDGAYDASKVMPWPGHKPRDPEVMAAKKRYGVIQARLDAEFKEDLLRENSVLGHPNADLCFEKALNLGSGRHEVVIYFESLVELLS